MDIRLPIIVFDNGDLSVFDSLESAEGAIEGIDAVEAGLIAMDSIGRRLTLSAKSRFGPARVDVSGHDTDLPALRKLLFQFLENCNIHRERLADLGVDDLISLAKSHATP